MEVGQTRADANRKLRREALRDQLEAKGLIQKVIESADDLADLDEEMDAVSVQRLRAANDARLKLIAKYLPDAKEDQNLNVGGQGDNPIVHKIERVIVRAISDSEIEVGSG